MTQLSLKPFILSQPSRKQNPSPICQLCSKQFSITTRQHLCKRCFRFVCDVCSPYKEKVYKSNLMHRPHRLCKCCFTESEILKKYVQNGKISWGEDSDLGRQWIKMLGGKKDIKAQKKRRKIQYTTTALKLWQSLNYTLRQLVGRSVDQNKQFQQQFQKAEKKQKQKQTLLHNKILEQVLQLLSTLMSQLPPTNSSQKSPHPQSLVYILIFFLSHNSPQNAIFLSKTLYQQVCSHDIQMPLVFIYLSKLQFSSIQNYKIQSYMQMHAMNMMSSATINYFNVQISIEFISNIFQSYSKREAHNNGTINLITDNNEVERTIAYLISERKQFIMKNSNQPELIQIDLLRNNTGLGDGFKKFVKLCEQQDYKRQNSPQQQHQGKNVSHDTSLCKNKGNKTEKSYEQLLNENEQLKIKNKNQQQQIMRLRVQTKKLTQKQKLLLKQLKQKREHLQSNGRDYNIKRNGNHGNNISEQSDQQEQFENNQIESGQINNSDYENQSKNNKINIMGGSGQDSHKKMKKRNQNGIRLKRNTTMSQNLKKQIQKINQKQQNSGQQNSKHYEQILTNKNKQILYLKKQIQILNYSSKLSQEDLNNLKQKQSAKQMAKETEKDMRLKAQAQQAKKESKQLKQQLQKMQQMNKLLLIKMKQLSNMLMDKQQQQVNQNNKTFDQLVQTYNQKMQDPNRDCSIF